MHILLLYEHHGLIQKLVYISNATEYGTVYTLDELKNIREVCDELGLYLMMDGARLGVALSTVDYTLNDLPIFVMYSILAEQKMEL